MLNVQKLQTLSKIKLHDSDRLELIEKFQKIIEFADAIKAATVTNTEEGDEVRAMLRSDVVNQNLFKRELIRENFPASEGSYARVPKVLEKK